MSFHIEISIAKQELVLLQDSTIMRTYSVSTALNGAGEKRGSFQTPRGLHVIRAKIGKDMPINTVFVGRRPTGEIYSPSLQSYERRDWILTRILWLSGLELHKNRLGDVDTMHRYIYIHGTRDELPMGQVGSRGCIRMRNTDIVELFDSVLVNTRVLIRE